jgi:hypothetical protein
VLRAALLRRHLSEITVKRAFLWRFLPGNIFRLRRPADRILLLLLNFQMARRLPMTGWSYFVR